jgi:hypothetical protein
MPRYKWDSPLDWLMEKAGSWDIQTLYNEFSAVVQTKLDSDQIQDLYQKEMQEDGYFRDLDKTVPYLVVVAGDGTKQIVYFCNSTCRNLYITTEIELDGLPYREGEDGKPTDPEETCAHCGGVVLDAK